MEKMDDAIMGYLQTVIENELGVSFLRRRSSWEHHARYYQINLRTWCEGLLRPWRNPDGASNAFDRHVLLPA
jgi:hypothetical protein